MQRVIQVLRNLLSTTLEPLQVATFNLQYPQFTLNTTPLKDKIVEIQLSYNL